MPVRVDCARRPSGARLWVAMAGRWSQGSRHTGALNGAVGLGCSRTHRREVQCRPTPVTGARRGGRAGTLSRGDQRFHHQIARGSSPPADSPLACPIKEAFPEWFGQNGQGPAPLGNRRSLAGAQPRSGGTPGAWRWKVKYGHALSHSATARSCEIIRDVIGDAPENAPKRKENRKPANPTPPEKTINIVLCGLLRACDRGVDILMKTRCGCCRRRLCVRCPRGEAV